MYRRLLIAVSSILVLGASTLVTPVPAADARPPKPRNLTQTRTVDRGDPYCQRLTVDVLKQKRTVTWRWSSTKHRWVKVPKHWRTVRTGTRAATAEECLNIIRDVPANAALPDLQMKHLDRCGAGDVAHTGGDCFMIEYDGKRKLLFFPVITINSGAGASEIIADRSAKRARDWKGYQTFYDAQGSALGSVYAEATEFYFAGDGHNHWHVRDFDNYRLLDEDGQTVARAEKHGYCLQDNTTYGPMEGQPGVPAEPGVYLESTSCGKGLPAALTIIHGLSRGWGDTYPSTLPDQCMDITDIPDGTYTVWVEADGLGAVTESDDRNNWTSMQITITGDEVVTHPETSVGGLP